MHVGILIAFIFILIHVSEPSSLLNMILEAVFQHRNMRNQISLFRGMCSYNILHSLDKGILTLFVASPLLMLPKNNKINNNFLVLFMKNIWY